MAEMIFTQLLVALLMGLCAVCLFIWGVLSGSFNDVEEVTATVSAPNRVSGRFRLLVPTELVTPVVRVTPLPPKV